MLYCIRSRVVKLIRQENDFSVKIFWIMNVITVRNISDSQGITVYAKCGIRILSLMCLHESILVVEDLVKQ